MAKSPHILIAGFIASGGLSFSIFSQIAKANKNLLEPISIGSQTSNREEELLPVETPPTKNNLKRVPSGQFVTPPSQLKLLADRQSYDARQKRYLAEGKVSAELNGALLKADRIEFDRSFRTLVANGRVRLKKGGQYFQASSFRYNLLQRRGELNDVYGVLDLENLEKDLELIPQRKVQGISVPIDKKANTHQNNKFSSRSSKKLPGFTLKKKGTSKVDDKTIPPLNSWGSPGRSFLFSDTASEHSDASQGIACPPILPPIPDWHPYSWALTTWGGADDSF